MDKHCDIDKLLKIFPFVLLLTGACMLLFSSAKVYSQFNFDSDKPIPAFNETELLSRVSKNVSDQYENSDFGFKMVFPGGWSGIETNFLVTLVQVSPSGVSLGDIPTQFQNQEVSISVTGIPMALVEMAMPLASAFMNNNSGLFGNSSMIDMMESAQKLAGCEHISASILKINGVISEEKTDECNTMGFFTKSKSYTFTTEKGLVMIAYSANSKKNYESNLAKFDKTVKSLSVSHPTDYRTFGEELLGINSHPFEVEFNGQKHSVRIDSTQNISNFAFTPSDKSVTFKTNAGKLPIGIAETTVNLGKILSGPYSVTVDGKELTNFITINDTTNNGTVLELVHAPGLHTIVIGGN
jgi:hypothetical protein